MAETWNSRRLRHERTMDRRYIEEQRVLARAIGRIVQRYAVGPDRVVLNMRSTRSALKTAIWNDMLKPYFIGPGTDPLLEIEPRSPYATLLREGVEGALRIQAERQASLINRLVRDKAVVQWLTGPRPVAADVVTEQRGTYDPWHMWVDPNGYRLSDRIWRAGIYERANIARFLDYHIGQGTSAVDIAELLEDYMTPGARLIRTRTPYGREGSYAARRLARTEITAAAGRGTVNAAAANPFVSGIRWSRSSMHGPCDICDERAHGGENGDGVYPIDEVPDYPAHPHCMCNLSPVTTGDTQSLVADLREQIAAGAAQARRLQGILNPNWLATALLTGTLVDVIERLGAWRQA